MAKITLYLNNDYELQKHSNNLVLYKDGKKFQSIPALTIQDIIIFGDVALTSGVINLCKENKISLYFNTRNGKHHGSLNFAPQKNIFPRIAQFEKRNNIKIACKLIEYKLTNQKHFLKSYGIDFEVPELNNLISEKLLGIEGSKANEYFKHFETIIKNPDFVWKGRSKHPPKDEINALLSLGYTLLASYINTICNLVALDPYIGFFHKDYYGRPSLVCDLMENYRSIIDKFIINMVNRKEIEKDDFEVNTNGIEYKLKNFGLFMEKWNDFFEKYKGVVENDIRDFAKFLIGESETFEMFEMFGK